MSALTDGPVLVHAGRGADGAFLAPVVPGDVVRRRGYRRHWIISSTEGQLVALVAKYTRPAGPPDRCTAHADDLEVIA